MVTRVFLWMLLLSAFTSCSGDDDVTDLTPVYLSMLSGEFSAETDMFAIEGGPNIDCNSGFWFGKVQFAAEHEEGVDTIGVYRVFSSHEDGPMLEDPAMGGYYDCYIFNGSDPTLLPNGENGEGSLRMIDNDGLLSWQGISQWGEVYFMDEVSPDGAVLSLSFQNDYGEAFEVRLIRDDGTSWPEALAAE